MPASKTIKSHHIDWNPIILAAISALAGVLTTYLTVSGQVNVVRLEMQSTITALQAQANQPLRPGPLIATQPAQVTSTPNASSFNLENTKSHAFAYAGGNKPNVIGWSVLSVDHTTTSNRYILEYTLPDTEFTWVGFATIYDPPINFAPYTALEYTIQTSKTVTNYQVKLRDKVDHEKYLAVNTGAANIPGVKVSTQNGIQSVHIELRGNFDEVNLEQIKELTFATNSDLDKGSNTFVLSDLKLVK